MKRVSGNFEFRIYLRGGSNLTGSCGGLFGWKRGPPAYAGASWFNPKNNSASRGKIDRLAEPGGSFDQAACRRAGTSIQRARP
jgi:hypothetical protein